MPDQMHTQAKPVDPNKPMSAKEAMLQNMAAVLDGKYQEYVNARQTKEDEWTRAIRQYEGMWDVDDRTKLEKAFGVGIDDAPPPVNITRPKTNIAIARMQDAQFPVGGDFNFILEHTPVPEAITQALSVTDPDPAMQAEVAAAGIDPQATPSPQQVAQSMVDEAAEAARLMTLEIRDNLTETRYGTKARLAIEDLAILGSAVIKGPVLSPHVRRMYNPEQTSEGETIQVLGSVVEHRPEAYRVDPRLFYPDPSARQPDEIEDCFELHIMSATDLMKLADSPAFMRSQVRKALIKGATDTVLPSSYTDTNYNKAGVVTKNRYVVKEYHGPLSKQVLLDGGVINEEDFEDETASFFGEVWVCNGFVIRMSLSFLEGVSSIPYSLSTWERDPSSVFGHGVPYLLKHPQRVINNAYVMLLDNASLTSGPQIVLNKEMIEPAAKDGNYDIAPHKVWFLTEYGADVREAMQFVNVPAQMDGIASIIDMAMQFADMESSTPLIQQGELPAGNNTQSGIARVLSSTNIHQKRASLNWDDNITKPLIDRYYHYNMQYGKNESAKGDLQVKVGGATERIDAEMRAQELERLLGLSQAAPEFAMEINPSKAFRQLATLIRAGDILRTPDEVAQARAEAEQAAQEQQNPEALKAQAAVMTAEAKHKLVELETRQADMKFELEQRKLEASINKELAEVVARREEVFAELQKSQDNRELALMKMASERQTTVEKLANELDIAVINNQTDRQKIFADLQKFREEVGVKMRTGEGI